ncbi:MAG: peptidylprolyl isomerase [Patescibacteria group bacterium]
MFKKDGPNPTVILKTNNGNITLELFLNEMPKTAGNFIKLAEEGFFDGTKFHRVIQGFVIQGGDPNSKGTDKVSYGRGGPGYTIEDEFVEGLSNVRGTISMANTGRPNSGGSQFFINLADNIGLDYDKEPIESKHPVFGKVISGMEVVDAIAKVKVDQMGIPIEGVVIENITIQ